MINGNPHDLAQEVWEAIAKYGVQASLTGELGPSQELIDSLNALMAEPVQLLAEWEQAGTQEAKRQLSSQGLLAIGYSPPASSLLGRTRTFLKTVCEEPGEKDDSVPTVERPQ